MDEEQSRISLFTNEVESEQVRPSETAQYESVEGGGNQQTRESRPSARSGFRESGMTILDD